MLKESSAIVTGSRAKPFDRAIRSGSVGNDVGPPNLFRVRANSTRAMRVIVSMIYTYPNTSDSTGLGLNIALSGLLEPMVVNGILLWSQSWKKSNPKMSEVLPQISV